MLKATTGKRKKERKKSYKNSGMWALHAFYYIFGYALHAF